MRNGGLKHIFRSDAFNSQVMYQNCRIRNCVWRIYKSGIRHRQSLIRSRTGFTLIEIIIVMLIIGIASGLVGIMISKGSESRELRLFTKDVSTVLRYARNRAVSEKKIYCFVIDKEENKYRLYSEDTDYNNIKLVMEKDIPEVLAMNLQDSEEESPNIEFLPHGSSTGGVLEVIHEEGKAFFINVNRITGKIDMEKAE